MIIRSKAPLRLGLAGGGSDVSPYCDEYGGAVLNATIDMYANCSLEPLDNGQVEFIAADRDETFSCAADADMPFDGLLDLHKGIHKRVTRDFLDGKPLAVRVTTYSDAPAGSGLGSSSTLVVAILTAYAEYLHLPLGEYDIAHLAFEIERNDVGLSGGRQDQYAATFGGVNFLEFHANDHVIVNPLRVKNWILNELEASTVLYYTGVSRESANIISQQIKNYQQSEAKALAAMHQIKEDASRMKESLLRGDIRGFAGHLGRSWEAKRQMADKISNPMIDDVLAKARSAGAYSGKVSGAGGGGFIMFMVDPVRRVDLVRTLSAMPGQVMHFHFVKQGVQAWQV
ncbi:MAG: dehydrogenase [Gammaproteobacteria bacterium]|nr:dehydrogenase [Gammaproteobacteria bacterium]